MKKIIFTLFLMIGAICANAQTAKIYKDGTVVQTIDNIDSVRFSQETTTIDIPSYAFSVAADKKVIFSLGNLQYTQSTNTWAFAANQYDIIGEANVSEGALADKIDLFGWSASSTTAPFGISTSTTTADYAGDFVDWGTNTIGTDAPNTWRTLTKDEWTYLFQHTHWTMAKVNDLLGFMLLPDGFVAPTGITVTILGDGTLSGSAQYFSESDYASNVYTTDQFAQLESLGVVFLPCAANRVGKTVVAVGEYGNYWSATRNDDEAWNIYMLSTGVSRTEYPLYRGNSVRLVKDVVPPVVPERIGKFAVAADKQITFSVGNLQYTQSTNTWAFAANQYDIIGAANMNEGALADKIDLFGWSASNTTAPFGVSLSTDKADYAGDFVDWGTNTIGTYAPNTWRTLTIDEWAYLFQHTHWTMAKVNDLLGFMLLPDGFVAPAGLTVAVLGNGNLSGADLSFNESDYASNVYTTDQFAQLEAMGVVFLPSAGYRNGSNVVNVGSYGAYWSATSNGSNTAKYLGFSSRNAGTYDWGNCDGGRLVRLVQDAQTPAAGSPAHTSADEVGKMTKEIKTRVVTVYQSGDKAHRFAEVDSVVVCPTVVLPPPAFSVSADKQITFSPGNLQYTQSTNTWAFAEHQYDFLGNANMTKDKALADLIDLFGWSADNTTAPFGIRLSTNNADYAGAFVDWGTNAIGSYAPNTWRTLTKDEWKYLLTTRANAAERMGVARINLNDAGSEFANGVILLPDDWTCPAGVTFKSGSAASDSEAAYGEYQTFTLAQWQALEEAGAVFLHAAGDWRPANTYVGRINQYGYVHTATTHDSLESYAVNITSNRAAYMNWDDRKGRKSVRLVRDL